MQRLEAVHGKPMDRILWELYIRDHLTVREVGDRLGITAGAVSEWLRRFDIEARPTSSRRVA